MKQSLLLFIILCTAYTFAQPNWQPVQNIMPNTDNQRFDDVFFLNKDLGWAANGFFASVYKTTDSGKNWVKQLDEANIRGDFYFRNIEFLNENIGFLGTLNGVLFKTTNGGSTWSSITTISPNPNAICGLDAVGSNTIYGCGAFFEPAHIIKSTDSGNTWEYKNMSTQANALVEIKFINQDTGYVAGRSDTGAIILKTTNGGSTWNEIYNSNTPGQYVWKLQILDNNPNIIFGSVDTNAPNVGKLIKTTDGGLTWTSFDAPESNIQAVGFINENRGWMGGHTTGFYETNDGGQTWINQNIGSNLNRIFIINSSLAYASGTTIYKFTEETLNTTNFENNKNSKSLAITFIDNPVTNSLEFAVNFKGNDNILINLYDVNGKFIQRIKRDIITKKSTKNYSFNVEHLSNGTYIIEIHNNLGRTAKKFLKK